MKKLRYERISVNPGFWSQWMVQLGQVSHAGEGERGSYSHSALRAPLSKPADWVPGLDGRHWSVLHILGRGRRPWLRCHCPSIMERNGLCLSLGCGHFFRKLTLRKENSKCGYYISISLSLLSFLFPATRFLTLTNLTTHLFIWGSAFTFLASLFLLKAVHSLRHLGNRK